MSDHIERLLDMVAAPTPPVVLPPLPHPLTNIIDGDDWSDVFTADQMREYGRACERAAYERAAKECEEFEDELQTHGRDREADVAWRLARRIEALGADK